MESGVGDLVTSRIPACSDVRPPACRELRTRRMCTAAATASTSLDAACITALIDTTCSARPGLPRSSEGLGDVCGEHNAEDHGGRRDRAGATSEGRGKSTRHTPVRHTAISRSHLLRAACGDFLIIERALVEVG